MLQLQNNPDIDEFLMNNQTIRLQIAVLEFEYLKTRHLNPVLADVDMEFYHSLLPVQELLGEMIRLERFAIYDRNTGAYSRSTATQKSYGKGHHKYNRI
mmetsp:Transcript_21871/g.22191  ORF Transcript_21871/g.22191 Transcript_21871/m.22191 type:complete len:99 (+) Transcript_21871:3-299(+)